MKSFTIKSEIQPWKQRSIFVAPNKVFAHKNSKRNKTRSSQNRKAIAEY